MVRRDQQGAEHGPLSPARRSVKRALFSRVRQAGVDGELCWRRRNRAGFTQVNKSLGEQGDTTSRRTSARAARRHPPCWRAIARPHRHGTQAIRAAADPTALGCGR